MQERKSNKEQTNKRAKTADRNKLQTLSTSQMSS